MEVGSYNVDRHTRVQKRSLHLKPNKNTKTEAAEYKVCYKLCRHVECRTKFICDLLISSSFFSDFTNDAKRCFMRKSIETLLAEFYTVSCLFMLVIFSFLYEEHRFVNTAFLR